MTGLGKKEEEENEIKQLHALLITDIIVDLVRDNWGIACCLCTALSVFSF